MEMSLAKPACAVLGPHWMQTEVTSCYVISRLLSQQKAMGDHTASFSKRRRPSDDNLLSFVGYHSGCPIMWGKHLEHLHAVEMLHVAVINK